jgi:hypothetical protein
LATFVASLETQSASQPASTRLQPASAANDYPFAIRLVTALTPLAVLAHGYHPYAEDGGLYAAGVKYLLDPALYPHSAAFVLEPTRLSIFAPAIAALARAVPVTPDAQLHTVLPIALFALHLSSIWVTLFATWMLSARCWPDRTARAGAVALLAGWLGLPVAGTALLLMDPYLTARSFATPCMALALAAALDATSPTLVPRTRRRACALCAASLAIAAAMHPLMAAYAIAATLTLLSLRSPRRNIEIWATAALSVSALALAAVSQHLAKPESFAYLSIASSRTYWFPALWRWYELAGLAAPLAILAILAWPRNNRPAPARAAQPAPPQPSIRLLARMAVLTSATSWLVATLFARAQLAAHPIARIQPLREFQVVYLIMTLALGAKLGESLLRRNPWRWGAAALLLGTPMLLASRATFPNSPHIELPAASPQNPWQQAFLWVRTNTPKEALFALDPDYINAPGEDAQCFRAIAERSALPDYSKDGGEASIAPALTDAWTTGQTAQRNLNSPATTDAARSAALRPLGVDWLVLNRTSPTRLECPYRNAAVQVCRLP